MTAVKKGISKQGLQIIAILCMFLDHTAVAMLSYGTPAYHILRFFGRITMPVMCFFIAEGFFRTSDIRKYAGRLAVFAVISHLPFRYFLYGNLTPGLHTSVIYTLFIALLTLYVYYAPEEKLSPLLKTALILILIILSEFGDYGHMGILWVVIFSYYRKNKKATFAVFAATVFLWIVMRNFQPLFMIGTFLAIIPLYFYNPERKTGKLKLPRYFFYIIYPVHMIILKLAANIIYNGKIF